LKDKLLRKGLVVAIIVLFVGASVVPSTGMVEKSNKSTTDRSILYVGGSGPGNYTTIQEAIDDASDGDTVYVYNDSFPYYENIVIDKSISLIGEDRNTTIIDRNSSGDVVHISADWVNLTGFTIRNSGSDWYDAGINVISKFNTIFGNNISNNYPGILLHSSSSNNSIFENIILNNHVGIDSGSSYYNYISANNITSSNWLGIYLRSSSTNSIIGNTISDNDFGIFSLHDGNNNIISGNTISNKKDGIHLEDSSNNTITGNNITSNNNDGIYFYNSCNYNTITGNNISSNNRFGIYLRYLCNNNLIYHNNLISNTQNARDECSNTYYNATLHEGNYWDDYYGIDVDGDGIGDTPYSIPGGSNLDLYPLMYPWYSTHPDTVYIDDDYDNSTPGWGYDRFNRIQYGINEVEGSTVYVYSGTYYEQIRINKSINLIGEDKNSTIIDGNNVGDVTVRILVDNVNISGFTIQESGNGYSGLCTYANNTNISNNIVKSNGYHGITVRDFSGNNIISNNIVFDNQQNGINIQDGSKNNIISSNNVSYNNYDGIRLELSLNNTILNNDIISNNAHGIRLHDSSSYTIISGNNIRLSNNNGIRLAYSDNNNISGNNICWNKDFGIELTGASNNIIFNNNILDSYRGIYLTQFSNNNNIITNCITLNEDFGIFLYSSDNNVLYHNNFVNNTMNAADEGSNNTWDNGYPSGGNYWDDYTGDDLYSGPNQDIPGSDGIGDTPYNISGGDNQDLYPCMEPNGWINSPPNIPDRPSGEIIVLPGVEHTYTTSTIDPDSDSIWFKWDWGDGTYTDWLGPYDSGEEASATASWSQGTYEIRVKTRDSRNPETNWSEPLTVNVIYPNLKTVFLFGFITNLSNSTNYNSFNVVKLLWIGFNFFVYIWFFQRNGADLDCRF